MVSGLSGRLQVVAGSLAWGMCQPVGAADPGAGQASSAEVTGSRPTGPTGVAAVSVTARLSPATPYRPASASTTRKARMSRLASWRPLAGLALRAVTRYLPHTRARTRSTAQTSADQGPRRLPAWASRRCPPLPARSSDAPAPGRGRRAAAAAPAGRRCRTRPQVVLAAAVDRRGLGTAPPGAPPHGRHVPFGPKDPAPQRHR